MKPVSPSDFVANRKPTLPRIDNCRFFAKISAPVVLTSRTTYRIYTINRISFTVMLILKILSVATKTPSEDSDRCKRFYRT
jgi:hypothetical protein